MSWMEIVQVERIAQTQPEEFQLPSPKIVREPLQKAGKLLGVRPIANPSPFYELANYLNNA